MYERAAYSAISFYFANYDFPESNCCSYFSQLCYMLIRFLWCGQLMSINMLVEFDLKWISPFIEFEISALLALGFCHVSLASTCLSFFLKRIFDSELQHCCKVCCSMQCLQIDYGIHRILF